MPKFGKKKKGDDDAPGLTSEFDFPSDDDESSSDEEEGVPGLEVSIQASVVACDARALCF